MKSDYIDNSKCVHQIFAGDQQGVSLHIYSPPLFKATCVKKPFFIPKVID
jgi:hypothetical protein